MRAAAAAAVAAASWKASAAARSSAAGAVAAAHFHSTVPFCDKPRSASEEPKSSFTVRYKRSDTRTALKDLLSGSTSSSFPSNSKQRRAKKEKSRRHSKSRRWWNESDEDDDMNVRSSQSRHKRTFTWHWPGEDEQAETTCRGFEWRNDSQGATPREGFWYESDEEAPEPWSEDNFRDERVALGLPLTGLLKLKDIKLAFHESALKWHPDKHHGRSQSLAAEKFKQCVDAYGTLVNSIKPE